MKTYQENNTKTDMPETNIPNFSDAQKIALVSLAIEMANADSEIQTEEVQELNRLYRTLAVSEDMLIVAKALPCIAACKVVASMADNQKIFIGKTLVRIIDADNQDQDDEIKMLNEICRLTGIDLLLESEP